MGRKRKVARPEDCEARALLPPCRVCEGPAGGFHYGVNSCEACKGFFHRCIAGKEKLKDCADGKCPVLYTIQKVCKMCRYNKCIAVGMAKQACKTGRYTVEKRTQDILEVKTLKLKKSRSGESPKEIEGRSQDSKLGHPEFHGHSNTTRGRHSQCDCSSDNNVICSSVARDSLSPPSHVNHSSPRSKYSSNVSTPCRPALSSITPGYMVSAHNLPCDASCNMALSLYPRLQNIRELYSDVNNVTEILVKARKDYVEDLLPSKTKEEMERKAAEHLETCRINQEMFGSLPHMPDQDYDNIYATTGLDADGRMKNFAAFNTQMELTIRAYAKFAKKVPGFSSLETQDQVTLIKYSHHEFTHFMGFNSVTMGVIQYSDMVLRCKRCCGNKKLEELSAVFIRYCDTLTELQITVEERVLMTAIALMAPDREHIVKSEKVRLIYELLNECLIKLFSRRSARPLQVYAKITDMMVGYRTWHHEVAGFVRSLHLDKYSNALDNPLLRDMFGGIFFDDFESLQTAITRTNHSTSNFLLQV